MAYAIVHHFPGGTEEQYEASIAAVHPSPASHSIELCSSFTFEPSPEFRAAANVRDTSVYDRAEADPEGFWANFACGPPGASWRMT